MTTKPASRKRLRPALSMNYIIDESGGDTVDTIVGVTAFSGHGTEVVSTYSARAAFRHTFNGVCEIMAKADPEVKLPIEVTGKIASADAVMAQDSGLCIAEANAYRVAINGAMETLIHRVSAHATSKGLPMTVRSHVSGPYLIHEGELALPTIAERDHAVPGLGVAEMTAALKCWADGLATLASIVNAEGVKSDKGTDPESDDTTSSDPDPVPADKADAEDGDEAAD